MEEGLIYIYIYIKKLNIDDALNGKIFRREYQIYIY